MNTIFRMFNFNGQIEIWEYQAKKIKTGYSVIVPERKEAKRVSESEILVARDMGSSNGDHSFSVWYLNKEDEGKAKAMINGEIKASIRRHQQMIEQYKKEIENLEKMVVLK